MTARNEDPALGKKLYVGNLSFNTTEGELQDAFEKHGSVLSCNVITDRETGRSRGFAFVEFDDPASADAAMQAMDGRDFGGRSLRVNEANERGGGGGGGRGGPRTEPCGAAKGHAPFAARASLRISPENLASHFRPR